MSAFAVLAGSYTAATGDTAARPSAVPVEVAPAGETVDQWAVRAQRALDSINHQLDIIADTEIVWNRAAETQRAAARSAPIEALQARKLLLLQRQASLRSQLALFAELTEARSRLRLAEQRLADIEAALATAPPAGRRTPEEILAVTSLTAQRDVQMIEVEARRAEVARLEQAVAAAARTPLPADDKHTELVSSLVIRSLDNEGAPSAPDGSARSKRPEALVERAGTMISRVRYDVPKAAPPDPRGPRDAPRAVGKAVGGVVNGVRQVVPPQPTASYGGGFGGLIAGAVTEGVRQADEQERRGSSSDGPSEADREAAKQVAGSMAAAFGTGIDADDLPDDSDAYRAPSSDRSPDTSDIKDWDRSAALDSGPVAQKDAEQKQAEQTTGWAPTTPSFTQRSVEQTTSQSTEQASTARPTTHSTERASTKQTSKQAAKQATKQAAKQAAKQNAKRPTTSGSADRYRAKSAKRSDSGHGSDRDSDGERATGSARGWGFTGSGGSGDGDSDD
ncbi:MAG: hypothetical protein AB7J32_05210 [Pseudonocardia sp.]